MKKLTKKHLLLLASTLCISASAWAIDPVVVDFSFMGNNYFNCTLSSPDNSIDVYSSTSPATVNMISNNVTIDNAGHGKPYVTEKVGDLHGVPVSLLRHYAFKVTRNSTFRGGSVTIQPIDFEKGVVMTCETGKGNKAEYGHN